MSPDLAAHVDRERARVAKDVWMTVMRRDGWRCRYCRRALESRSRWARWRGRQPEVDHDVPVSRTDVRKYRQGGVARDYRHGGTPAESWRTTMDERVDWCEDAAFVALGIAVGTFMGAVMRDLGVPSFARVVVIAAAFYVALVWWRRDVS